MSAPDPEPSETAGPPGPPGLAGAAAAPPPEPSSAPPPPSGAGGGPSDGRLPGLADGPFLGVLALATALIGLAWWHLEGYQIADSVEYIERAIALVRREEVVDSHAIRSFGFAGILVPIFAVADWIGLEEYRYAVYVVRVLQIGLSLTLVALSVRLAARFVPRSSAYVAGALLAANPAFLQWSVSPISDVTAGICLALALGEVLERGPVRRAVRAGFWLGLSFLMAYKTLALIGPLCIAVAVRERWSGRRYLGGLVLGFAACLFLQCVGDGLYYGRFGLSIWIWTQENIVRELAERSLQLGNLLDVDALRDLARYLYNNWSNVNQDLVLDEYQDLVRNDPALVLRRASRLWYLQEIGRALLPPVLALTLVGALRMLVRPSFGSVTIVAILALVIFVLSNKGAKSFRLWLPFMAWIAVVGALGWDTLFRAGSFARPARRALGWLCVVASLGWAAHALLGINMRKHGGFWRAVEVVNRAAEESLAERRAAADAAGLDEVPKLRLACAYHWGVMLRESKLVELVKLPHQLDGWPRFTAEMRAKDLAAIAELDWFIAHLPVLQEHPELMAAVNRDFEIEAVLYDRFSFQGLGPLYVMHRRVGEPDAPTFWDVETELSLDEYRARHGLGETRYVFKKPRPDGTWQELRLLGFDWRPIDGSGYGWITYHWAGGPFEGEDYTIIDRVTGRHTKNVWQNDHRPAYGVLPTTDWAPGTILREGYVLVPEAEPFAEDGPTRPLGADYRRGDAMPASLWIKVVGYDDSEPPLEVTRLVPFPAEGELAVEQLTRPEAFPTFAGHAINDELMARVGRFLIAIQPRYRWTDPDTPVPHEQTPTLGRGL